MASRVSEERIGQPDAVCFALHDRVGRKRDRRFPADPDRLDHGPQPRGFPDSRPGQSNDVGILKVVALERS
ncbi:hypothetical protein Are01nite_85010 [Actinoplanes regularis]|nr:hypothetical protein Are01nite_85010 [Actinoplanes regularis]